MLKLDFYFIHDGQVHFRYVQHQTSIWQVFKLILIILRNKPVTFIAPSNDSVIGKGDKIYDFRDSDQGGQEE